jgi:hypothetical protein
MKRLFDDVFPYQIFFEPLDCGQLAKKPCFASDFELDDASSPTFYPSDEPYCVQV